MNIYILFRLLDVEQSEGRVYLVFEFVDRDLKSYFKSSDAPLSAQLIQVSHFTDNHQFIIS